MAAVTSSLTGDLLIGATAYRGRHGEIRAVNPVSGTALEPSYGLAWHDDLDRAAALADAAFDTYRETSPRDRAAFLRAIATNIEMVSNELVLRASEESGLPAERMTSELARTTGQLRLFADVVLEGSWLGARVDPALPKRTPLPRPDIRQRRVPVGPVAVFGASNFPLAFSVAGGDTASALAAGAPVIVKAHDAHPGTSELVGRAIQAAVGSCGLPEGVFSLLFGSGEGLGTALVADRRIKAVGFTGSRRGGLALVAAAAERPEPIPVFAEMSSVNPVVILPHARRSHPRALGEEFAASMTTGAGQLCTSPGLVFVVDGDGTEQFVQAAAGAIAGSSAAPMLTAGIQAAFSEGAKRLSKTAGVHDVAEGIDNPSIASRCQARLFQTTGASFLADSTMQQEIFGSASLIVMVRDQDELIAILESLEGQLALTVHADEDDTSAAAQLMPLMERKAGRILFNGWPTGVEVGHAMVHGGPFPATSDSRTTSVGSLAIERFLRPVSYQNVPARLLPQGLDDENISAMPRRVNGVLPAENDRKDL